MAKSTNQQKAKKKAKSKDKVKKLPKTYGSID